MSQDASRTEAAQAGLFHEQTETAQTGEHHKHVTADEVTPDHLAQQANSGVEVAEPPGGAALAVAAAVAVAVLLVLIAFALALQ